MLSFIIAQRIHQHLLLVGLTTLIAEGAFLILLSQIHTVAIAFILYIAISFYQAFAIHASIQSL